MKSLSNFDQKNKSAIWRAAAFLLFSMMLSLVYAQDGFELSVKVINKRGGAMGGVKVWMHDKNTGDKVSRSSNSSGYAKFTVGEGLWTVNLPGLPDYEEFPVAPNAVGSGSITVVYDLENIKSENNIINKRNFIDFKEVKQPLSALREWDDDHSIIKLKVHDRSKRIQVNIPVEVFSVKQEKKFVSKTDSRGIATFKLKLGENYAIDVAGIRNYAFTEKLTRRGMLTISLQYEPTKIAEKISNDTIEQMLPAMIEPTSSHVALDMTIHFGDGTPAAEENVYLQQIAGTRVYKGKTDANGNIKFLVQKGEKYMIHFDFERDVDVLNFTKSRGFSSMTTRFAYRPDPKLQYPERYIPDPGSLFLKEFETFLTKNLPEPTDKKVDMYFKWGNEGVNDQAKEAVLEIGIKAKEKVEAYNSPYLDLAFVIDKSGSMAGYSRIESLKETMVDFVDQLRPEDRVSLITFESTASKDIPLKKIGKGEMLKLMIDVIEPAGGTNIYEGMVMGYEELLKKKDPQRPSKLVLLTDGYGSTEPKKVVEKSKEYNARGIDISAIGVGEGYNYALLKLLTGKSGGFMKHAGEAKDIKTAFRQQLSNLLFPIGTDAKLSIKYNNKIRYKHLYGLKESSVNKTIATFNLGSFYAGYQKVALARFDLESPNQSIENQPIMLELSYFDLEKNQTVSVTRNATLKWEPATGKYELLVEQEQKKLYAIAIMNQSIKVMADAFAAGDAQKALDAIRNARKQVLDIFPDAADEDVNKLLESMVEYGIAIENYIKIKR